MHLPRVIGAALLTASLVAGGAVAANADDSRCTITLQLPATAIAGDYVKLDVIENDACKQFAGQLIWMSIGPLLDKRMTSSGVVGGLYVVGSGGKSYDFPAPTPNYWHSSVAGSNWETGTVDVITTEMQTSWEAAAPAAVATTPPAATSVVKAVPPKTKKFKNCTAVHKYFDGGIAKVGVKRDKKKGKPSILLTGHVRHSNVAYRANKGLDRDHDGVACEKG